MESYNQIWNVCVFRILAQEDMKWRWKVRIPAAFSSWLESFLLSSSFFFEVLRIILEQTTGNMWIYRKPKANVCNEMHNDPFVGDLLFHTIITVDSIKNMMLAKIISKDNRAFPSFTVVVQPLSYSWSSLSFCWCFSAY